MQDEVVNSSGPRPWVRVPGPVPHGHSVRQRGEEDYELQVGQRLRDARQRAGWSQAELAARLAPLGLPWHQTTVAKTELAMRPLRVNELIVLADALHVPLHELLPAAAPPRTTLDKQKLAELWAQHDRLLRESVDARTARDIAESRYEAVQARLREITAEIDQLPQGASPS